MIDSKLLKALCEIHATSGNESPMTQFLLRYIENQKSEYITQPVIYTGGDFGDNIVMIFGKPTTAVYAHMDSIGFTVGYDNNLIRIGGPKIASGYKLRGTDSSGYVEGELIHDEDSGEIILKADRIVGRGTDMSFVADFRETEECIQCCYIDNRLGVYNALKLADNLENGAIVFTCYEEHGGGSAAFLAGFLFREYGIRQALISDITWVTSGVHAGHGVALSLRDSWIPRKSYVDRIRKILDDNKVTYQIEVESAGGSDGKEIQLSPFPVDWCFIGAPEEFVHSPDEKVHKSDIISMLAAYKVLMRYL